MKSKIYAQISDFININYKTKVYVYTLLFY